MGAAPGQNPCCTLWRSFSWGCKKGSLGRGPVVSDNKSIHIRIAKPLAGACCDGLLPVRGERVVAEYAIHGVIICQADAGCLWAQ